MAFTRIRSTGITTTDNYEVGVITATKFVGGAEITSGNITGAAATFSGNVSIAGTLTYMDVTNVDSVGVGTFQSNVQVGAGISVVGVSTFSDVTNVLGELRANANVKISNVGPKITLVDTNNDDDFEIKNNDGVFTVRDATNSVDRLVIDSDGKIGINTTNPGSKLTVWADDSDVDTDVFQIRGKTGAFNIRVNDADASNPEWAIRTYSSEPIVFMQGTGEKARIDSDGRLLLGTTTEGYVSADDLTVATTGNTGITIRSGTGNLGTLAFSDGTSGAAEYDGYIQYSQADQYMDFGGGGGNIRLRITSAGSIGINSTSPDRRFTINQDATCRMNLKSLSNSTAGIEFGDEVDHNAGYIVYDNTDHSMQVGVGTGKKLHIDSSGLIANNNRTPSSYGSPNLLISGSDSTLTLMGDGSSNSTSYTGIKFRVAGASTGDYTKAGIFSRREGGYNDLSLIFALDTVADATSVSIADEKMRITSAGKVLIGHSAAQSVGTDIFQSQIIGTNYALSGQAQFRFQDGAHGASIILAHSRNGTKGSHTILQDDDEIGKIRFFGSDGNDFGNWGAQISAKVDGTPGSDVMPGRLEFHTTPAGSGGGIERLRITSSGIIGISGNRDQIAPTAYDELTDTNNASIIIGSSGITTAGIMFRTSSTGAGRLYFGDNSGNDAARKQGHIEYHNDGDFMRFGTNGSERLRITSSGAILVGTDTPTYNSGDMQHEIKKDNSRTYTAPVMVGHSHLFLNNSDTTANAFCGLGIRAGTGDGALGFVFTGNVNSADFVIATDGGANGVERLRIFNDGDVRFAGTNLTDATNKSVNLVAPSFDIDEEDVNLLQYEGESGFNQISFGGGTGDLNAATILRFLTASAVDTTGGTERLRIDANGRLHTGYVSNFGADQVNVMATNGGGISIAQNNSGNAGTGTTIGTLSFQAYHSGQNHENAEAKISAIPFDTHTGSSASTDLVFYTKAESVGPGSAPSERLRINANGLVFPTPGGGTIMGTWKYRQTNQSQNYEHKILGPYGNILSDDTETNSFFYIEIAVMGTGTTGAWCEYHVNWNSGEIGTTLTHVRGNSSASSNRPYMVLDSNTPCWKMDHSTAYPMDIKVSLMGGAANKFMSTNSTYGANP